MGEVDPIVRTNFQFTYLEGAPRTVELLLTEEPGQADFTVKVSCLQQPEKQKKENARPQR